MPVTPAAWRLDLVACMQVVALVTYTYLLLIYYVLTAPYLPSTASHIALQVLYAVAAAATLALGVAATYVLQAVLKPAELSTLNASAHMPFAGGVTRQTQASRIQMLQQSPQATSAAFARWSALPSLRAAYPGLAAFLNIQACVCGSADVLS